MLPKKDHERDLELDKKIQALRRKNEALMKRHKVWTSVCKQRPKIHWSSSVVEIHVWGECLFWSSFRLPD